MVKDAHIANGTYEEWNEVSSQKRCLRFAAFLLTAVFIVMPLATFLKSVQIISWKGAMSEELSKYLLIISLACSPIVIILILVSNLCQEKEREFTRSMERERKRALRVFFANDEEANVA